ncbi:MAG: aldolase [Alphaproteobacteria bacterium]|nr:aldolase [Alphaproteobacteria bacterium]MBU0797768.1 aldolase [Alphaproteobacteria bacterium]MBU0887830.1 aldolase [Alphaproteobacteria bacterium]MBU1814947.1 aldolase [Alphaproteobacteria bacterium]MBU2090291.1 aldolase [Alphaproteobacteria bacterium]
MSFIDEKQQARIDLAAAFRWAARLNFHEGVCNHFSLQIPGAPDRFLINPHGAHFSEISASMLCTLDSQGNALGGSHPPEPTAFYIHSAIHRANPNAACVLHTHMPYATALCLVQEGRVEMVSQNALRYLDQIAYDDRYNGLVLDFEEGDRIARVLGDKRVLFLANHGVIVIGPTVADAFDDLYYLERACQHQVLAMSTGRPLKPIDPQVAAMTYEQIEGERINAQMHFQALKRILDRQEPDYAD